MNMFGIMSHRKLAQGIHVSKKIPTIIKNRRPSPMCLYYIFLKPIKPIAEFPSNNSRKVLNEFQPGEKMNSSKCINIYHMSWNPNYHLVEVGVEKCSYSS